MLQTIALKLLTKAAQDRGETSTVELAEEIGVSQQSVSRVLTELEREGYIAKRHVVHGLVVTLTDRGRLELRTLQAQIATALSPTSVSVLKGTVEQGLGEGKYYLSLGGYKRPLAELLGAEPYPGTLNVRVDEAEKIAFLTESDRVEIPGWTSKERTYGPVAYYPVEIAGRPCGLIMPIRTTHGPGKVEIVATVSLRSLLKLRDGDAVTIERRG